jgi:hypothetical protein
LAAPVPSARVDPTGRPLGDGYRTAVAFSLDTNIQLWEKEVTPPGIEGDNANDTSSQQNDVWRTFAPRALATMTELSFTAKYDPSAYSAVVAIVNVPQTITVHFPDGASLAFYGFLKSFKPNALKEGDVPLATITVVPTMMDPVNCVESGPTYTAGTGTAPSC